MAAVAEDPRPVTWPLGAVPSLPRASACCCCSWPCTCPVPAISAFFSVSFPLLPDPAQKEAPPAGSSESLGRRGHDHGMSGGPHILSSPHLWGAHPVQASHSASHTLRGRHWYHPI